ncbi:GIY-YIG nuclease family protein [Chloroflexota bacterium]
MNERFEELVNKMRTNLRLLLEQPTITIDKIGITQVPQKGVYVFFEDSKPIYVGRSNGLKKRLKEHSQRSADHYSATLAFRIAKNSIPTSRVKGKKQTNAQLMKNSDFIKKFEAVKERISRADIRFIPIEDQIEQAMFGIYAYLELGTEWNDFNTH